jgi:predicted glycosyltransferase
MVVSGTKIIVSRKAAATAISLIKSAKKLIANGLKAARLAAWMGIRVISRYDKVCSGHSRYYKIECYSDSGSSLSGEQTKCIWMGFVKATA